MRFSIIVPIFNAEKYIGGCVDSVLRQTCADYELIIIDDGSTDGSATICQRLADANPQMRVLRQANGGQLSARLSGIQAARGDYCLFLDADDALLPESLGILAEALEAHNCPDLLIYSFFYVEPSGRRRQAAPLFEEEREFTPQTKRVFYEKFFTGTGLNNVWTKAVKRSVFDGTFPDYSQFFSLRCGEDRLHSMGIAANANRIVYLPQPLYEYRLQPGSVTRQFTPESVARFNTSCVFPCEVDYLRQWNMLNDEFLQRLRASYVSQAVYTLDLFYRNLKGNEEKQRLIRYDWRSFVPPECTAGFETNPFLNDVQKNVFRMMMQADEKGLRRHFLKKKLYRTARTVKRKLIP